MQAENSAGHKLTSFKSELHVFFWKVVVWRVVETCVYLWTVQWSTPSQPSLLLSPPPHWSLSHLSRRPVLVAIINVELEKETYISSSSLAIDTVKRRQGSMSPPVSHWLSP